MNKEETLALFAQGRDAWNAWSEEMLAQRAELEAKKKWGSHPDKHLIECPSNFATIRWFSEAEAHFFEHTFDQHANFVGYEFPGRANFERSKFEGGAIFSLLNFVAMRFLKHLCLEVMQYLEMMTKRFGLIFGDYRYLTG